MRLEFGYGHHEGFETGDSPWLLDDDSVDEAHATHILETLKDPERAHFLNEVWRVLKPDAQCHVEITHWSNPAARNLPQPLIKEGTWYGWNKGWRDRHCPALNETFQCDFDFKFGYDLSASFDYRCDIYRLEAITEELQRVKEFEGTVLLHFMGTLRKR